jgi:hypothetical protein
VVKEALGWHVDSIWDHALDVDWLTYLWLGHRHCSQIAITLSRCVLLVSRQMLELFLVLEEGASPALMVEVLRRVFTAFLSLMLVTASYEGIICMIMVA